MRRRKARPGFTMRVACCRCPIRESSSFFRQDFFPCHSVIIPPNRCSFSSGRRSSSFIVSSTIPRNAKSVAGPSSLLYARGTPSLTRFLSQLEQLVAPLRSWRTHKQEVVQVVQQLAGPLLLQCPLQAISYRCEYLWC